MRVVILISGGTGTRNPSLFRVPAVPWRNGPSASSTLKNHQIWQKMMKSLVLLAFSPFFGWFLIPVNRSSDTCSATSTHMMIDGSAKYISLLWIFTLTLYYYLHQRFIFLNFCCNFFLKQKKLFFVYNYMAHTSRDMMFTQL